MKTALLTLALLFSSVAASAQVFDSATDNQASHQPTPMKLLLAARESLINTLRGHKGFWGVSICGAENELFPDGGTNWLTVYIMKDAPLPEIPTGITELVPVVIVRKKGTEAYK